MSYKGREIESKLIVQSKSLTKISNIMEALFEAEIQNKSMGISADKFWKAPADSKVDFIRARDMSVATQVTVKGKDKDDPLNRIELEFLSHSKPKEVHAVLQALFGKPIGALGKTYYFYTLENEQTTVSVYTLFDTEPEYLNVIVEVEARDTERMLQMEAKVLAALADKDIKVARAPGSLYELFIARSIQL